MSVACATLLEVMKRTTATAMVRRRTETPRPLKLPPAMKVIPIKISGERMQRRTPMMVKMIFFVAACLFCSSIAIFVDCESVIGSSRYLKGASFESV